MKLSKPADEPLSDLFYVLNTVRDDTYKAFYRERQLFWMLENRGFFNIPETADIALYADVFKKMSKENENQLQQIEHLLKVINDEMKKSEHLQEMHSLNAYFSNSN